MSYPRFERVFIFRNFYFFITSLSLYFIFSALATFTIERNFQQDLVTKKRERPDFLSDIRN